MRVLLAVLFVLLGARAAVAEPVGQEWVGLEVSPLAVSTARRLSLEGSQSVVVRGAFGPSLKIRGLRHRWSRFYWTPLQVGVVVATLAGSSTLGASVGTEGGLVLPAGRGQALELGLAAELGALGTTVPGSCDGTCMVSGTGPVPSLAVRWLVDQERPLTLALFLRLTVPLRSHDFINYNVDHDLYTVGVVGLDLAFGR